MYSTKPFVGNLLAEERTNYDTLQDIYYLFQAVN